MRVAQFVLLALAALLASSESFATATKGESARNLLSFEDVDSEPKTTKEERITSGATGAGEGGRIGAGGTVVSSSPNGGGTVTVSIYNNKGLWQLIKKWWLNRLGREKEERASSGVIGAGEGGRAGAGATVVSTSNDNGGGTVTVTVFDNNGLFQRIVRWWKGMWSRQVSTSTSTKTSTTRLRQ